MVHSHRMDSWRRDLCGFNPACVSGASEAGGELVPSGGGARTSARKPPAAAITVAPIMPCVRVTRARRLAKLIGCVASLATRSSLVMRTAPGAGTGRNARPEDDAAARRDQPVSTRVGR